MRIIPNGKLQLCEYFNGNIVLIPQAVYSVVGMNNPSYSHSIGDFDYGLRAKKWYSFLCIYNDCWILR